MGIEKNVTSKCHIHWEEDELASVDIKCECGYIEKDVIIGIDKIHTCWNCGRKYTGKWCGMQIIELIDREIGNDPDGVGSFKTQ